ncbi:MAG: FtsW/RodA/SpoVE family cell cycle protein [Thermoanaerobacteraceae bacterium]|nr:FtsW/RodA/SpoVE family cell cycle protein [Thermoanaerobacteraceae bacterium]
MVKASRYYRAMLLSLYLFLIICFSLLSLSNTPINPKPLYMGLGFMAIITIGFITMRIFALNGDAMLFLLSNFLCGIGLVMIYRVNEGLAYRQFIWITGGVAAFIVFTFLFKYYGHLIKYYWYFGIASLLLLAVTIIFGKEIGGSTNWIIIAGYSFQPSEFVKILFCLTSASFLRERREPKDILYYSGFVVAIVLLLFIQKDLGTAIIFFLTGIVFVYTATGKLRYPLIGLTMFAVGAVISYLVFSHVRVRFEAWLNPWMDVPGKGYQIVQSLFAIGAGGLFGSGLGLGHPEYIPAVSTDLIFSIMVEEFGLLVGLAVIVIYLLIFVRAYLSAMASDDSLKELLLTGIASMLAFQTFIIIGGVTKFIPLTGVTLPFISYGGSSIVTTFCLLGIMNSLSIEEVER